MLPVVVLLAAAAGSGLCSPSISDLHALPFLNEHVSFPASSARRIGGSTISFPIKKVTESVELGKPVKAVGTPCCLDTLLPGVCRQLYNRDHERFSHQCRANPDFSFIQCCHSCHFNPELFTSLSTPTPPDLYKIDAENMLLASTPHCFDRHGQAFCEAFVLRRGTWARHQTTCEHSGIAFRVCRKTCGYCYGAKPATVKYNSDIARDHKKCSRIM